ncbi:MAG: GNAT family N-acetyltransferase [bacterium]
MNRAYVIREVLDARDVEQVRRLVMAHGNARSNVPGVENVYADAAQLPGPYVPPRGGLWLAVSNDVGLGCVALRPHTESVAEVKRMFVDAEWRGKGVARALLTTLIDGARARGYTTLRLGTLRDMYAAQSLYDSVGFVPIERYRQNELTNTVFYELSLTGTTSPA